MHEKSRRDVCLALPALALLSSTFAKAQTEAKDSSSSSSSLAHSQGFSFDDLPVKSGATGSARHVLSGTLPTGEVIEMHETTLLPGKMPHAPHRHFHSEFMLIREGTVEFSAEGKSKQIGPGGIAYAASNELHGLKNIGNVPANYFVIAIGKDLKAT